MRGFRSLVTLVLFVGMGLAVLSGYRFSPGGRNEDFFLRINTLVAAHGTHVVGYGLIAFGVLFSAFWAVFGHNR